MSRQSADVVGFGMLTSVAILVVEQLPEHNTGELIQEVSEFIFDDAAIVACLLRQWDIQTGLIGTTVGNDPRGRSLARQLKAMGVLGNVRLSNNIKTPLEIDISDATGARTYFWQRPPHILATLDTADLSLIQEARILYVDWYDGDHILRAMERANECGVSVFLNLEYGHSDQDKLERYVPCSSICQAVTDPAQRGEEEPLSVANKLLEKGVKIALITLAEKGCLVTDGVQVIRAWPPEVKVVDGCGAGATFSAGFIYGYLKGWRLEDAVRFATMAASIKVTHAGLQMASVDEIKEKVAQIRVEKTSW